MKKRRPGPRPPAGRMRPAAGDRRTRRGGDPGGGVEEDVQDRVFEPFFTTKEVNRGTGLGLAVCHGIVARHRGAIEVDSAPDAGTRITVWLPAWQGDSLSLIHISEPTRPY